MKPCLFLCVLATALVFVGCSSAPTQVDHGPIAAKTFSFVNPGNRAAPAFGDNREHIHQLVQEAITRNLASRGVTRTPAGGDVTVAYLMIVGNNASTAAVSDYFGYGRDAAALSDKAQEAYTHAKTPNYFEAGTLVIDVIDAKTYQLLKRGHATGPRLRNLPPDTQAATVQEAVDKILRDLRLAP
jgi:hypothetical protein